MEKPKMQLLIKSKLCGEIPSTFCPTHFISTRKLFQPEIRLIRKMGTRRLYLPCLNPDQVDHFFKEFATFWDKLIAPFDSNHFFWRNVVSSKMQEWECSAGYLTIILFTLQHMPKEKGLRLLIIPSSVQEEKIWRHWAKRNDWELIETESPFCRWVKPFVQEIENTLRFIWFVLGIIKKKFVYSQSRIPFPASSSEEQTLIASLFYPHCFKNGYYRDPFFHDLHQYFLKNGKRCFYIADCLTYPELATSRLLRNCREVNIYQPYALVSWSRLLKIVFSLFFQRIKIKSCDFMGDDFSKLIEWNVRRFTYDFNLTSEIFYEATKKVCQKISFNRLVYILEGNVFERACIQAFRESTQGGRVDGYSHAVVYPLSLKLHLTDKERGIKPEPDWYICSGAYGKDYLSRVGNRPAEKMISGCTLRKIPQPRDEEESKTSRTILIALDGVWSSSYLLDWLIEHAELLKDFFVRVRAHPNVPLEGILRQCTQQLPAHFELSKETLASDIRRSFCVLYRQTSVGMQALMNGVCVVHLAVDSPISGDPIKELEKGKWVARSSDELKHAVHEIYSLSSERRRGLIEEARNFVHKYFARPTDETLKDFLKE